MTEGNIASWRMKEGDSFTAGDVILEIETDKATMDVEAQDDGILFKITQPDGSKGVKVGDRIAVMAEEGDDLNSLEMPAEDASASTKQPTKGEKPSQQEETSTKQSATETPSAPPQSPPKTDETTPPSQSGQAKKQSYPLFPAVQQLLHENGLSNADADSIPASGPSGRLLKGDVLAYLGRIEKGYPAQISARINRLSHLDLSNIQLAKPPAPKAEAPKEAAKKAPELEKPQGTRVVVPVSLAAVIATQKRVQDALGIFLPLSTFLARASELANEDLPPSKQVKPTADSLFNAVLGLDKVQGLKSSRGHFFPEVTGVSPMPPIKSKRTAKKPDIIDMLAPKEPTKVKTPPPGAMGISAGQNVFAVTAQSGEKSRAREYLERMKFALEEEPGKLVL